MLIPSRVQCGCHRLACQELYQGKTLHTTSAGKSKPPTDALLKAMLGQRLCRKATLAASLTHPRVHDTKMGKHYVVPRGRRSETVMSTSTSEATRLPASPDENIAGARSHSRIEEAAQPTRSQQSRTHYHFRSLTAQERKASHAHTEPRPRERQRQHRQPHRFTKFRVRSLYLRSSCR